MLLKEGINLGYSRPIETVRRLACMGMSMVQLQGMVTAWVNRMWKRGPFYFINKLK
jgi:hypothetical protein